MANHKVRKVNEKDFPKKSKKDKLALKKMISTERHPSAIFELLFFLKAMQFQCLKVTVMIVVELALNPGGGAVLQ